MFTKRSFTFEINNDLINMTKIVLTENQLRNIFLIENRSSKNQSLARKMVRSINPKLDEKDVTMKVLHYIPNVRKADFHLFPTAVRFVLTAGKSLNNTLVLNLNKYIGIIAPKAKELGLDQNANGMSLQDFFSQFQGDVTNSEKEDREVCAQYGTNNDGNFNGYKIVPILNFDKAVEYSRYTDWCITYKEQYFLDYTNNGSNVFYFLLKDGFENIPMKQGPNCPFDEYGLSMISVSFRRDGSVNTVTCRWNHDNGGNDFVMTPEQVSKLIGADVYSIYNPENIQSSVLEGVDVLKDNLEYGLKLCKNTTTGNLYVYSYDFRDNVSFNSKNYVVYNGKSDEGDNISVLIDRRGNIYSVAFENNFIDTIENNGLLYVATPEVEADGRGIYNAKTMEEVKDIPIKYLHDCQNVLVLTDDDGYKLVIDKHTNKFIFDDYIDKCVYRKGKVVCFNENQISEINADTCEIEIYWSDIIGQTGKGDKTLFWVQNKEGLFVISYEKGLLNKLPIEEAFYVEAHILVSNEDLYLLMSQQDVIAIDMNKEFCTFFSKGAFKNIKRYTTVTPIDIKEIFS